MPHRMLKIQMGDAANSYLASAAGILRAAGWWEDESWKLAGATGAAFRFVLHEDLCPSSPFMYDWGQEHVVMMDRIGVYSEVFDFVNTPAANTFGRVRATAVDRIKGSIDRGVGVVTWAPTPLLEFGIITGYDDTDGVFFVEDAGSDGEADPLLYENLGRSQVPLLSYQLFHERCRVDPEKAHRNAVEFAVSEWNKDYHMGPAYASGRRAYANLLDCLKNTDPADLDRFGLSYNLMVYGWCKAAAAKYLECRAKTCGSELLSEAATLYRRIAGNFARLREGLPFPPPEDVTLTARDLRRAVTLAGDSMAQEERAIECLGKVIDL